MLQTFVLLLAALLPIRKHVLETCHITSRADVGLVTIHTTLDMTCLVGTWLLFAVAPAALQFGKVARTLVKELFPLAEKVFLAMSSLVDYEKQMPKMLAELSHSHGPQFLRNLQEGIQKLEWDSSFILRQAAGSMMFLLTSAAIAGALFPKKTFSQYMAVGICGPLWLLGKDPKDTSVRGAYVAMACRSLLFLTIVGFRWLYIDRFSVELYTAAVFNRLVEVDALRLWAVALLALHCSSGLAALYGAQKSLEAARALGPAEEPTSHDPPGRIYGTFPSPGSPSVP